MKLDLGLQYYIAKDGNLWNGPHAPDDTLHWAPEGKNGLFDVARRSEIGSGWISITPHQALRILARKS